MRVPEISIWESVLRGLTGSATLWSKLMFKILVLQQLYHLSEDQTERHIRDRYSFGRFLDLYPEDAVPMRSPYGVAERDRSWRRCWSSCLTSGHCRSWMRAWWRCHTNATRAMTTRRSGAGRFPGADPQSKRRHKDGDARRTRRRGVSSCGCKNHVSMDLEHGLVWGWEVTDAAFDETEWGSMGGRCVSPSGAGMVTRCRRFAQSRSPQGIPEAATHDPLSRTRTAVDQVFAQQPPMGSKLVRAIDSARARVETDMMNPVYDLRRLVRLMGNVLATNRTVNPVPINGTKALPVSAAGTANSSLNAAR